MFKNGLSHGQDNLTRQGMEGRHFLKQSRPVKSEGTKRRMLTMAGNL